MEKIFPDELVESGVEGKRDKGFVLSMVKIVEVIEIEVAELNKTLEIILIIEGVDVK